MEQSIVFAPTLDERQLDREARTVDERLATVGEDLPVSFDVDDSALSDMEGGLELPGGGVGGGGGIGGAASAGGVAGLASRIPKPIAGVTTGAALPVALAGAVGVGLLSNMADASARLQTSASLLGVAADNVFRPLGDDLDKLLVRPVAKDILSATESFESMWESDYKGAAVVGLLEDIKGIGGGSLLDLVFGTGGGEGEQGFFQDVFEDASLTQGAAGGPVGIISELGQSFGENLAEEFLADIETPSASAVLGKFDLPSAGDVLGEFEFPSASSLRNRFEWPSASSLRSQFSWPSASSLRSMFSWPQIDPLDLSTYVSGVNLSGFVSGVSLSSYVTGVSLGDYVTGVSLGEFLSVPDWLSSGEQPAPRPSPPTQPAPSTPDFGSPEEDPAFPGGGGRGNRPGDTTPGVGDDDDDDDDGGYTPPPSGGGAGAGGGTGGGTIMATGGFVERSGRATIHAGERVLPESQVSDRGEASFDPDSIAEGIRRAGGMGGDDMSAVEDKLDRLTRAVRRLEGALDVTVEVNDREIARATSAASNTDPIARR